MKKRRQIVVVGERARAHEEALRGYLSSLAPSLEGPFNSVRVNS